MPLARKRAKRRTRKQPRRLTPPLFLRNESGREVVEVDQEIITSELSQSPRTTAFLSLAPGLRIEVGSRCINKRRVTVLRISPKDYKHERPQIGDAFEDTRRKWDALNHFDAMHGDIPR